MFEGTVIAKKHGGVEESFTVRRISYGVGVEKVFPLHAPTIEKVETVRKGKVRRAKLYYPALDRRDAARAETESFLSKVYGGSLGLMMSAMVESRRLSESDIAELSAILEKAGGGES